MKPPAFAYLRAESIPHAEALLHEHGEDARLLAGGQSLIAALNLRLSHPSALIDITPITGLKGIAAGPEGLRLGALATHNEIRRSPAVAAAAPLMAAAAPHIAHEAIRNCGTIGGSIAFADPAAEWPACALALDAVMVASGAGARRRIPAESFFRGLYETALGRTEVLEAIEVPPRPAGERCCFLELSRRPGDYAIVGLAAVAVWREGRLSAPRLAFLGVGSRPALAASAMAALDGTAATPADVGRAAEALGEDLDPPDDLNASAEMRLHLARTLLRRAMPALAGGGGR
jgi:carbon-monoxide dehydrogenase medium subunit